MASLRAARSALQDCHKIKCDKDCSFLTSLQAPCTHNRRPPSPSVRTEPQACLQMSHTQPFLPRALLHHTSFTVKWEAFPFIFNFHFQKRLSSASTSPKLHSASLCSASDSKPLALLFCPSPRCCTTATLKLHRLRLSAAR